MCIHQPDFAPYLGFFHRLLFADVLIILDDVQFLRRGWHHRDKIKTQYGEKWLTLSVKKGDYHQKINEVILSENQEAWISNHLNYLKENYGSAPGFSDYFPRIKDVYQTGFRRLFDINMALLRVLFDVFGLDINIVFSSDLNVEGASNQKLINLMKVVGGTHYLSGTGAEDYLDKRMFEDENIIVEWQQFNHPVYQQLHGEFIPNLSCLDLLFNCGSEAREVLWACRDEE